MLFPSALRNYLVNHEGDFCSVFGIKLLHNVSYMDLHSAFTHVKFISDDFVGLSLSKGVHDFSLTLGELPPKRLVRLVFGARWHRMLSEENARREVHAAGSDCLHYLHGEVEVDARRNETAYAELHTLLDLLGRS